MSIMDQVKKNLREWYSLAADRTGEMAKISVRMYDKYGISREIERQLSELGSYVYHAVEQGRTEFADDAEFSSWIDRIKGLESDLHAKVAEIDDIRLVRQQKQAQRDRDDVVAAEDEGAAPASELSGEAAVADAETAPEPVDQGMDIAATDIEEPTEILEAEEASADPPGGDAIEEPRRND